MKKILLILISGIVAIANCVAMDVAIENPYKDIEIIVKTRHSEKKHVESCKKSKKGKKKDCSVTESSSSKSAATYQFSEEKNLHLGKVSAIDVAIFLEGNGQILPQQSYDAVTGLVPLGTSFEQRFIMNGKEGVVVFKADVKFDNDKQVIKTLKVKVLKAELDGVEFNK